MAKEVARVVIVGVHKSPIQLDPQILLTKELELIGSKGYPTEFMQVVEMLSSNKVDISPLISHPFPLEQFMAGLEIASDPHRSVKVLIQPE